eukprot:s1933_g9.t1
MLNLEDGAFGTAGVQSGKVLWRRWTLELEVFCTGWTVFFKSGKPRKSPLLDSLQLNDLQQATDASAGRSGDIAETKQVRPGSRRLCA